MLRSTFRRELTEAREAYRREAEAGLRKERELQAVVSRLVRASVYRGVPGDYITISIRIDPVLLRQPDTDRMVAERVLLDISRFGRDYRADLRQNALTGQRYAL
jgi:hypothetical protein